MDQRKKLLHSKYAAVAIAVVVLFAIGSVILLYTSKVPSSELLRSKYPYSGYSVADQDDFLDSIQYADLSAFPNDFSLEGCFLTSFDSIAVEGTFLQSKQTSGRDTDIILPEIDTPEYHMLSDTAISFNKSIEEVSPKVPINTLRFRVDSVISGECEEGIIEIKMDDMGYSVYPDVSEGDRAVLIITHSDDGYYNYSTGFFYLTSDNTVLSAEKFPSLNQYSGMSIEQFSDVLRQKHAEARSK